MERKAIEVLLADDHVMVREGLSQILDECDHIRVVEQANDGAEVLELVARAHPDVIVLDYSMPKLDASSVISHVRREHPEVKILVLTVHENIHYAVRVLECGGHGYVVKSAAVQELVTAIESVYQGEVYVSSSISQDLLQHMRRPIKDRAGLDALSHREFDMLRVLGSGMSLKDGAKYLNISTSTASTYRSRLMEKLGLHNTAEIIRYALEHKIVE